MSGVSENVCIYIYKNWIQTYKSQRSFALDHNIEESVVRKIKNTALHQKDTNYSIPVNTLHKICEARNITLTTFFELMDL